MLALDGAFVTSDNSMENAGRNARILNKPGRNY